MTYGDHDMLCIIGSDSSKQVAFLGNNEIWHNDGFKALPLVGDRQHATHSTGAYLVHVDDVRSQKAFHAHDYLQIVVYCGDRVFDTDAWVRSDLSSNCHEDQSIP